MGDAAEDAIQAGLDAELYGDLDEYEILFVPQPKTCRQCGVNNLWWGQTEKGWRLFDEDNHLHSCSLKGKPK